MRKKRKVIKDISEVSTVRGLPFIVKLIIPTNQAEVSEVIISLMTQTLINLTSSK